MRSLLIAAACIVVAATAAGVALGTGGGPASDAPDTILHHGRIATMDGRGTVVAALAVRDGEIVAAGDDGEVMDLAGDGTRSIDLGGRRVVPGLVDAHLPGLATPCFSRTPRFDALYRRGDALRDVAGRAARTPAGRWLSQLGRGWNVAQLDAPGMITRAELDAIAPNHPVYLEGAGFRGGQLNGPGLRALGLRAGSPGVMLDPTGRPTGQVVGAARARARRAVTSELAALTPDEREACLRQLVRELNRRGTTAWDDPGGGDVESAGRLHRAGELNARIRVNLACSQLDPCLGQLGEIGDENLRIGGIGGQVLDPGRRGVYPPARYRAILGRLAAGGWSFQHGATSATTQHGMVEQWERVNRRRPITELRWRMLHPGAGPSEPNPDALARLAELNAGVVPTAAPVKGGGAPPPFARIHASGTRACLGTGGAPYAPFVGLWYAISGRTDVPGRGGVAAGERLDREQALELATRRCDWFMSLDGRIGSLEVGRLADLVVLSDDYFHVPVDEIRTLTSVLTMVGGRVVYAEGAYTELEP